MKQNNNIPQGYKNSPLGVIPQEWENSKEIEFKELSNLVSLTNTITQQSVFRAINTAATLRNWLIGYYIVEFEQKGKNRAEYGAKLLMQLEKDVAIKGLNVTLFKVARAFYLEYQYIREIFQSESIQKSSTLSHKLKISDSQLFSIRPTVSNELFRHTNYNSPTKSY